MKLEARLWITVGIIFSIFVYLILLTGCKKDDPQPVDSNITTTQTLSIIHNGTSTRLYINGIEQTNLNETFTLEVGDTLVIEDKGRDKTLLNPDGTVRGKEQGLVFVQVIIDNIIVYEANCGCDAYYTQTI